MTNHSKGKLNLIRIFVFIMGISLLVSGCARSVTDKSEPGNDITMEITFKDTIDTANYYYYVIFSNSSSLNTETSNSNYYFISPGITYDASILDQQDLSLAQTYDTYFDTWSDYMVFKTGVDPDLFNGSFDSSTSTFDGHMAYQENSNFNPNSNNSSGATITFSFQLSYLTGISDTLYFTIVTVDKSASLSSPGNVEDSLNSVQSISLKQGEIESNTDINFGTPSDAADIQTWRVEVF